jgi:uncharacterized membrane protein YcaP (DUF421 family)
MDSVIRAAVVYIVVLVIFKIAGRRTLSEITTFDFVLLLIIGEATQQALLGDDFSITNAALVIITLIMIDIALSLIKRRFPALSKFTDGQPIIVVEHGRLIEKRARKARIDESDVLEAARNSQGLERMSQIKFAVLEKDGKISIIPQ